MVARVPTHPTIKITVEFPPDETPYGRPQVRIGENAAHRVVNARDGVATFHNLPAGKTLIKVLMQGQVVGSAGVELPASGVSHTTVTARAARVIKPFNASFVAAQCNFRFGGAPDAKRPATDLNGWKVKRWAEEMHKADVGIFGMQEAHVYRLPYLAAELAASTGRTWKYVECPMGIHQDSDWDHDQRRDRVLHSGVAILWQTRLIEPIEAARSIVYRFRASKHATEKYQLVALGGLFRLRRNGRPFWFWTFKLPWGDLPPERRSATLRFRRFIRQQRGERRVPVIVAQDMNTVEEHEDGRLLTNAYYRWVVAGKYRVASRDWFDHLLYKGPGIRRGHHDVIHTYSTHSILWGDFSDHHFPYATFTLGG